MGIDLHKETHTAVMLDCWNTKLGEITFGNRPPEFPKLIRKISRFATEKKTNPDFLIDGEAFDCYSPSGSNVRNIWKTVEEKVARQAERIVLNLDDYSGSIDDLYNQFMNWAIADLKELLIIKDGKITRWIP